MTLNQIHLKRAQRFLISAQAADGSFSGHTALAAGVDPRPSASFFITPFILLALSAFNQTQGGRTLCNKALDYIKKQQKPNGAYNYWPLCAQQKPNKSYPDDLDDTALAFTCRQRFKDGLLSGKEIAAFAKLLCACELKAGGPYNTWIAQQSRAQDWRDLDCVVNANIAFALSGMGVKLTSQTQYFDQCLQSSTYPSKYYLSPLAFFYGLSRTYRGTQRRNAINQILELRHVDGHWGTALETALALCALLRWRVQQREITPGLDYLDSSQLKDGSWPASPFYIEGGSVYNPRFYASPALTTAVVLEAAALAKKSHTEAGPTKQKNALEARLIKIIAPFTERNRKTDYAFGKMAADYAKRLSKNNFWRDNLLLASHTKNALGAEYKTVNVRFINHIETGHIFGLAAFGIIDELIDRQAHTSKLPFAIFNLRQFYRSYTDLITSYALSDKILNDIEKCLWQENYCRLLGNKKSRRIDTLPQIPKKLIYKKSLGCALPALMIASHAGLSRKRLKAINDFFSCLLSARQWGDDAHDFLEDLKAGRLTPLNLLILKKFKKMNPTLRKLLLQKHAPALQKIFWKNIFFPNCARIETLLKNGQTSLKHCSFEQPNFFYNLIAREKVALFKSKNEYKQLKSFIREF